MFLETFDFCMFAFIVQYPENPLVQFLKKLLVLSVGNKEPNNRCFFFFLLCCEQCGYFPLFIFLVSPNYFHLALLIWSAITNQSNYHILVLFDDSCVDPAYSILLSSHWSVFLCLPAKFILTNQ